MKFRNKTSYLLPKNKVDYPLGSFLSTPKGYFYVRSRDVLLRIVSKRVLDSWSPHRVIETSDEAIAGYSIRTKLPFRNGSLIRSMASGKMYLIESGKKRQITSPDTLDVIQAKVSDFILVSIPELSLHETGENIP